MSCSISTTDDLTVAHLRALLEKANVRVPPKTRKITLFDLAVSHNLLPHTEEITGTTIDVPKHRSDDSRCSQNTMTESALLVEAGARISSMPSENDPEAGRHPAKVTIALRNTLSVYDDISYLAPGFDAFTLPAPRLRNILLRHEVSYQKTKTKADLVRLFNEEIAPKAEATLRAMENVEATDEGIMDMGR